MRVETVNHVEHFRKFRRLYRQIRRAPAAQNHHVNFFRPTFSLSNINNGNIRRRNFHTGGISAGKNGGEFSVKIFAHGEFHAASEVAIAQNSNSHKKIPPIKNFS